MFRGRGLSSRGSRGENGRGFERAIGFLPAAAMILAASLAAQGVTTRASVDISDVEGNDASTAGSISDDGHFVAFHSLATNLVPGDTNARPDIFVKDLRYGDVTRVSVDSVGREADGGSFFPVISADGRYVAFESLATNLVAGDTNASHDIFVHDCHTGTTERVSVDSQGQEGNRWSAWSTISADGEIVAFLSVADNLVAGDTNQVRDVFVHDRSSGVTTRASVDSAGVQANNESTSPYLSADGRYLAFDCWADNLVLGDVNGNPDVFLHDRLPGATTCVSVDSAGVAANGPSSTPSVSGDGRYVAFESAASNLVPDDANWWSDIFVHDRQSGHTTLVSVNSAGEQADGFNSIPWISDDGRFVAFDSDATNLIADDPNGCRDVFVRDRARGTTTCVSVDPLGVPVKQPSFGFSISGDGRYVAFHTEAYNVVPGDTNNCFDVFVRDRFLAAAEFRNAGSNPASYTATTMPVLGGTYSAAVDVGGTTGHAMAFLAGYGSPLTFPLAGYTALVNPAGPEYLGLPSGTGPIAVIDVSVPFDPAYVGFRVSTQAAHVGGGPPVALSNAIDLTLGY